MKSQSPRGLKAAPDMTIRKILKYIFFPLLGLFILWALKLFLWDIPSLQDENPEKTALMNVRGGDPRYEWKPLSRISGNLRRAVIAAEDGRFYEHNGIDFHEIRESFKRNMAKKRFARGGSTITMQLAKNIFLTPDKNLLRKAFEVLIALKMEHDLSKDRIMELYLNVVEWGEGVYGAEAASRHYFKKSAASLSVREAAFLAAILPSPRRWGRWPPGPYVNKRISVLLARMGGNGRAAQKAPPPEEKADSFEEPLEEEPLPRDIFLDDGY